MSAKEKPALIEALTNDEMRSLARAARELVRPHMQSATGSHGLVAQNVYTWILGRDTLSSERRKSVMTMFGLTHWGQLMANATHAWVVDGQGAAVQAEGLLARELQISDVAINYAYTKSSTGNELVGAEVRWTSDLVLGSTAEPRARRLLVTVLAGSWDENEFKTWVMDLFLSKRARKNGRIEASDIEVSPASAINIWRFKLGALRLPGGKRALTVPRKALLPFNKDVVSQSESLERPVDVLESMTPRFLELANKTAELRGVRVGPADLALVRRAKASMGSIE